MTRINPWIAALLIVLAGLAGWMLHRFVADRGEAESATESAAILPEAMAAAVEVEPAAEGDLPVVLVAYGTVIAAPQAVATISSRAGGRVAEVLAAAGQAVHQGDLLLRFEPQPLAAAQARARSELKRAQGELLAYDLIDKDRLRIELESAVQRARSASDLAEAQQRRLQSLRTDGLVAEKAMVESQQAVLLAQRDVDLAKRALDGFVARGADLKRATLEAEQAAAQAALDEATRQLEEADVVAPQAGQLTALAVHRGDRLEAGVTLGTLLVGDARLVSCLITPRDLARVRVGASATWLDDRGEPRNGRVTKVVQVTSGSGSTEVLIEPATAETQPVSGDVVRVEIEVERLPHVILVPEVAVVRRADQQVVVVIGAEDRARVAEVKVLGHHAGRSAIAGEVHAGDRVATAGAYNLPDGAHVVPALSAGGR